MAPPPLPVSTSSPACSAAELPLSRDVARKHGAREPRPRPCPRAPAAVEAAPLLHRRAGAPRPRRVLVLTLRRHCHDRASSSAPPRATRRCRAMASSSHRSRPPRRRHRASTATSPRSPTSSSSPCSTRPCSRPGAAPPSATEAPASSATATSRGLATADGHADATAAPEPPAAPSASTPTSPAPRLAPGACEPPPCPRRAEPRPRDVVLPDGDVVLRHPATSRAAPSSTSAMPCSASPQAQGHGLAASPPMSCFLGAATSSPWPCDVGRGDHGHPATSSSRRSSPTRPRPRQSRSLCRR